MVEGKGDPDTEQHHHSEGQEFGFIESLRKIPCQESHNETPQSQGAHVFQDKIECNGGASVAYNDDLPMFICICVNKGRRCY